MKLTDHYHFRTVREARDRAAKMVEKLAELEKRTKAEKSKAGVLDIRRTVCGLYMVLQDLVPLERDLSLLLSGKKKVDDLRPYMEFLTRGRKDKAYEEAQAHPGDPAAQ